VSQQVVAERCPDANVWKSAFIRGRGMCHRGTMSEPLRISVLGGSSVNGTCLEAACPDAALNLAGRALALFQTPLLL